MRRSLLLLAALSVVWLSVPGPSLAQDAGSPSPLGGDWVGWAYLDEAGDLPLRLRIEADPDAPGGLVARFDELVSRRYDLPVARVEWQAPRLVLLRERPGGSPIRLEGELFTEESPAAIRGTIDWAGYAGGFELTRAPERLSRTAPESFEDCQGSYRLRREGSSEERTMVIGSRFWGELLFTDVASGRFGTLFPVDRDSFFAGSAMYVADPVHARVRFTRDDDGEVPGIDWVDEETGRVWSGERIAFVEEEVSIPAGDGLELAGTLIRPDGSRPLPAVVLLGGSSWRERGSVRPDATVLASFGMAVLIYDKRGFGESGGEDGPDGGQAVDPTVPFARTADDALAAVAALRERHDVIASQVGLAGRSRGGWFAPLAASRVTPGRNDVAFLILFVAPALSPAEQETTRRLNVLRDAGASEATVAAAAEALRLAWHYGATSDAWSRYAAARAAAVAAGVDESLLEAAEPAETDPDAWSWVRLNMAYDPIPALERVTVPVLALFGGADRNVTPEQNLGPMRAAFERAGNDDAELVVVPDANHGLRVVERGADGSEVAPHRQVGFGDGGWARVERWLAERFDLWGGEGGGR